MRAPTHKWDRAPVRVQEAPAPCHLRRHPGVNVRLRLQNKIIGIEAIGPFAVDAFNFGSAQARLNGTNHVQSDFILKCENVIEGTIETLGPQMPPGLRLYHLGGDTDTTTILAEASLQQVAHA